MKKVWALMLVAFSAVAIVSSIKLRADEEAIGDIVYHFQNWDGEYENLGAWTFGGTPDKALKHTGADNFGVTFEIKNADLNVMNGFIAVGLLENGNPDWDNPNAKQTGNVEIPAKALKAGVVNHVYVFQGAVTKTGQPGYYLVDSTKYNLLLVYADPSNSYEENIGVHSWNGWTEPSNWGKPVQVFTNGASHGAVPVIKVGMLHSDSLDAGLLIYAGDDANKKTGDVTLKAALEENLAEGVEPKLGDVGFAYVYSKGNGYTGTENVNYEASEFVKEAFSFKLLPMGLDDQGQLTGTYAPRSNQAIVSISSNVVSPNEEKDITEDEAKAKVKAWFKIVEKGTEKELEIDTVNFSLMDETLKDFVIILKNSYDLTKEYTVQFDLGLADKDLNKKAELDLNLDTEAPTITFISPGEFNGQDADERIITVEWNKKFNRNLFPTFVATDNRDGDLTKMVFVPVGEFSKINTNVVGDYKIMLQVEDTWGNVTQETFIFRVAKKVK